MKNYYGVNFNEQRKKLLESKKCRFLVDFIKEKANAALEAEYIVDKMSDYMSYYSTGHRDDGEHIRRRDNAIALAAAFWLFNEQKYLDELVDVIHIICNEFTWCIPAHSHIDRNPKMAFVIRQLDLYQATTARTLTEIAVLLGEKLPYYTLERIEYELRRRVFEGYKNYPLFPISETNTNNWATVTSCGAGAALLHFGTDEEINTFLPRVMNGLDRFIRGADNDGCCREGTGYWRGGYGNYIYLANLLYEYSNGKIDYFKNKKMEAQAYFPQKARLNKNMTVSFADASSSFNSAPGLFCFLKKKYSGVLLPELELFDKAISNIFYTLIWMDPDYKEDKLSLGYSFLEDSQWYINRKEKFSFAAKGGHNYEPHNHNDLGSFMIVVGEDNPLVDLGAPEYIRYENYDDRMVYLNFSSHGHSVPIIDGEYQGLGEEYNTQTVTANDDTFSLNLENAYQKGLIKKANRTFKLSEEGVVLTDVFEYSKENQVITERFVTRTKPKFKDGEVDLGSAKILFDANLYSVNASTDSYNKHGWGADPSKLYKVPVYLIDFTAKKEKQTEFLFDIRIK